MARLRPPGHRKAGPADAFDQLTEPLDSGLWRQAARSSAARSIPSRRRISVSAWRPVRSMAANACSASSGSIAHHPRAALGLHRHAAPCATTSCSSRAIRARSSRPPRPPPARAQRPASWRGAPAPPRVRAAGRSRRRPGTGVTRSSAKKTRPPRPNPSGSVSADTSGNPSAQRTGERRAVARIGAGGVGRLRASPSTGCRRRRPKSCPSWRTRGEPGRRRSHRDQRTTPPERQRRVIGSPAADVRPAGRRPPPAARPPPGPRREDEGQDPIRGRRHRKLQRTIARLRPYTRGRSAASAVRMTARRPNRRTAEALFARTGGDAPARRRHACTMSTHHRGGTSWPPRLFVVRCCRAPRCSSGSALTVSAANGQTGRTLELNGSPPTARDVKQLDARPRGLSTGDQIIGAVALRQGAQMAGRLHLDLHVPRPQLQGPGLPARARVQRRHVTASGGGLDRLLPGRPQSPPHDPTNTGLPAAPGHTAGRRAPSRCRPTATTRARSRCRSGDAATDRGGTRHDPTQT